MCAPVPSEFVTGAPVYRDCDVDHKAVPQKPAAITIQDIPIPPGFANACYMVEMDVVVDASGHPIPSTAKVLRQNNQQYTDAILRALSTASYRPAVKDGKPVPQLVRHQEKAMLRAAPLGGRPSARGGAIC